MAASIIRACTRAGSVGALRWCDRTACSTICRMQLLADSHVVEGFLKSWGMILASEIGDKTFFIAAIMAMKHSRTVVRCHGGPRQC